MDEKQIENLNTIGETIIEHARKIKGGLSNEDLAKLMPTTSAEARVKAINILLQKGAIEILKKQNSLIYRLKDDQNSSGPKGADNEEKIVYSIIEQGGNKGIWIRDIRVKSNLIMTQLNKILKNLENKKLIKAVKSVSVSIQIKINDMNCILHYILYYLLQASKKKVYMLYNMEPDRSITGGAWYQDQDFEAEFVDVLNQQSLRYLQMRKDEANKTNNGPAYVRQMACCSVQEVHTFISELGISKVKLDEDDLETILKTVVFDGKAEKVVQVDGSRLYRAVDSPMTSPGLVQMPCGICPIIKNCSTCGEVTSKSCQYMTEWLE